MVDRLLVAPEAKIDAMKQQVSKEEIGEMTKTMYLIIVSLLVAGLVLAGCPEPIEDGEEPQTVTIAAIPGVSAPAAGNSPVNAIEETTEYTGTVAWGPAHDPFQPGTAYTATITLTAKARYTFEGVVADFFTVACAKATNAVDSGRVTAVFLAPPWDCQEVTRVDFWGLLAGPNAAPECQDAWYNAIDTIEDALAEVEDPNPYNEDEYECDKFSDFTAARLGDLLLPQGYQVKRAMSYSFAHPGGTRGQHHWVFVVVSICGTEVWVPIECTPPLDGYKQKDDRLDSWNQRPRIEYIDQQAQEAFSDKYFGKVGVRAP